MGIFKSPLLADGRARQKLKRAHEDEDDEQEVSDGDSNKDDTTIGHRPGRPIKHRAQRYQHLEAVNTLMHRFIIHEDWVRAEKAFALLIRLDGVEIRLIYKEGIEILNHIDMTGTRTAAFLARLIIAFPFIKAPNKAQRNFPKSDFFARLLADHRIKYRQYEVAKEELDGWLLVPPYQSDHKLWGALAIVCGHLIEKIKATTKDENEIKIYETRKSRAERQAKHWQDENQNEQNGS